MKRHIFVLLFSILSIFLLSSWNSPGNELINENIKALNAPRMIYPCFFILEYVDGPNAIRVRDCYTCQMKYGSHWNDWGECNPY